MEPFPETPDNAIMGFSTKFSINCIVGLTHKKVSTALNSSGVQSRQPTKDQTLHSDLAEVLIILDFLIVKLSSSNARNALKP